ncbi:MAG: ATP-binding protein [Armatimonadia bacterium]
MIAHDWPRVTIAVAAGKGGTGKTLLATSLALVLQATYPGRVQLLDCDVEEPNAHLLMRPVLSGELPVTVLVPQVDLETCTRCGKCAHVCQNSAIAVIRQAVLTFPNICSGCGACAYICLAEAIAEVERQVGVTISGTTAEGVDFHTGRLNVGEAKSTPVTKAVKRLVCDDMISILDAPPGTACPMQETVAEADYCLLITEPTPFGLSDLRAAVETCRAVGVPCGIIINRHGSGYSGVEEYCEAEGLEVLALIPQDRKVAEAYSRGEPALAQVPEYQRVLLGLAATILRGCQNETR